MADQRYVIAPCYTGKATQQFVVWFTGVYVSGHDTEEEAQTAAIKHKVART